MILICFFISGITVAQTTPQVVVLSSHKTKKKAKLDISLLEKDFYLYKGYPKLVEAKSIGLKPGTWVWIAGYCTTDESINFVPDRDRPNTLNLPLDEQKFLLKKLKASFKTAYVKNSKSTEKSCPLYKLKREVSFLSKSGPSDTGPRWSKKPFSFTELSRFAIYLSPEQAEASNYLASYGYKYLQRDENLLQIIYKNNFDN